MSKYPQYILDAFGYLGYEEKEVVIEQFVQRWGGLELDLFPRVLQEGQGQDVVVALFVVGTTRSAVARELLVPYLKSVKPMERWMSALSLGRMHDERALLLLLSLLTQCLPPPERPSFSGDDLWIYNSWRLAILLLLAEWERPDTVPALLVAFDVFRQQEQMCQEEHQMARRYWRWCQGEVMYALGWQNRFDLLADLDVPEQTRQSMAVYQALGYLHAHTMYPDVFTRNWRSQSGLQERIMTVLHERLALSEEEQKHYVASYKELQW